MTPDQFSATIDSWVSQTKERQVAVFRQSAQSVVSKAQSMIPVDTGFARASIRASLSSMPLIDPESKGDEKSIYRYDASDIILTIAKATADDPIYVGWTANYVIYLEYGHSKQAPSGFVRLSAEQWPQIVQETSEELKSRAGV